LPFQPEPVSTYVNRILKGTSVADLLIEFSTKLELIINLALKEHSERRLGFENDGPTVFRHTCNLGLEDIVSKRKDSSYRSRHSPDWPR
jgi:ATP-dependent DNA ligase